MNGYDFTSAWLCPVDRLPSGLQGNGALVNGEKDNMPLGYRVEIVVEECAASQLYLRLANTTLVT